MRGPVAWLPSGASAEVMRVGTAGRAAQRVPLHAGNVFVPAAIIGQQPVAGSECAVIQHTSPRGDEGFTVRVPSADRALVKRATGAAYEAAPSWSASPWQFRADCLRQLADVVLRRSQHLAQSIARETGKPIRHARLELAAAADLAGCLAERSARDIAERTAPRRFVLRRPHGVVAVVTPWNNPVLIPLGKIGPALLYGNTVVWKPSPQAAAVSAELMTIFAEAGFPPQVVQLVNGDGAAAEALMQSPSVAAVSLTGSSLVGEAARAICHRRRIPLQAELGGNNAAIVWDDCDLDAAAAAIVDGAFSLAGQRCTANRRVIVPQRVHQPFLERLKRHAEAFVWGDPLLESTQAGPLVSHSAVRRVASVLARCRGAAREVFSLAGPSRETDRADFDRGAYFPPTIVCCDDPESELVREESFAPVLVVQTAASWEHALELLNRVAQGLVAAVFTESPQRQRSFLQHARAGILKLNCSTAGADVLLPFGGWKASGLGPPEHGDFDREFYTRPQALYLAGNVGLDLVEAAEAPYLSQGSQRAA